MTVHVFGVRHHGPGSARSVRGALDALAPDIVLIEGPPDADDVVPLVAHPDLKPPVALLVYASDAPERAIFYPLAVFSPEWQALRFAAERGVPSRFIDLPQANQLAAPEPRAERTEDDDVLNDPIGALSRAAGFDDREIWWEQQIEQRQDARGTFEGILEAIAVLRAGRPPASLREARREAFMRRSIRAAQKEGFARIAVVCGAWHAPALVAPASVKADDALLRGLPKVKVEATWIPWTYGRLAASSGYGAGIASPGWYEHLWNGRGHAAIHWSVRVAQLLRGAQLEASPSSVIDTVRLAEALAALRALPMPGLAELNEAAQAVLCAGESAPMRLVRDRLVVGAELGSIPEDAKAVPLQRDLTATAKTLRLKVSSEAKVIDLDLRKETDRARSRLFHRLGILGISWALPATSERRGEGTFHELWELEWRPDLAIAVVEANVFGNTLETAATAKANDRAHDAATLAELTALLRATLLAELPAAVDPVLARIEEQALTSDVLHLMAALPDLVRAARYGDVRGTHAPHLHGIVGALFTRIVVGLPPACASLDDAAARAMVEGVDAASEAVALLDRDDLRDEWLAALATIHTRDAVHGLLRGTASRLLAERGRIDATELERLARLALSPAVPAASAAGWIEGLLGGSAQLLLHDVGIWSALDAWVSAMTPDVFTEQLPLVRRAFAAFGTSERRAMGEKIRALGSAASFTTRPADDDLDAARAARVIPILATLLGVPLDGIE